MQGHFDDEIGGWVEPYHNSNTALSIVSGKKLKTQKWQYQECGYISSQKPPRYGDKVTLKVKLAEGHWNLVVEGRASHIGGRCKLFLNCEPFGTRICTFDQGIEPDKRWDMGTMEVCNAEKETTIIFENCGRDSNSDSYSLFFSRILFIPETR